MYTDLIWRSRVTISLPSARRTLVSWILTRLMVVWFSFCHGSAWPLPEQQTHLPKSLWLPFLRMPMWNSSWKWGILGFHGPTIFSTCRVNTLLQEIRGYLSKSVSVRRGDVMSAWSGLRPLVRDPNKKDTKSLARNHIIEVSRRDSNEGMVLR